MRAARMSGSKAAEASQEATGDDDDSEDRVIRRNAFLTKATLVLVLLLAAGVGGYYSYYFGVAAETSVFRSQFFASVDQVKYSFARGLAAKAAAGALAASCAW